jgi:ParB-like chromosome segregation protein Spo0J
MVEHEYKKLKVSDLIPYVNNSRTHSEDQINQVAASIKEFGFTNPILVDEDGGIIAGHGRVMAAKKLGLEEAPCIELVGLTATQKKAYIIADNQLALNAGWDFDLLKLEVETLQELDFDVGLLGFDDKFLSELLDLDESKTTTSPVIDDEYLIVVMCDNEEQQAELYEEFQDRQLTMKIMD